MKFLISLLFISLSALAASPFEKWPCHDQLLKTSKEWKSSDHWEKHSLGGKEEYFLASETEKIGEWILARKSKKGVALARAYQGGRLEVSFEGAKCEKKIIPYMEKTPPGDYFSDKDLRSHIEKNKTGIIYVWSPRMGLSEKGIPEIQKAARDKNLPLLILMGKDVPDVEYIKLRSKLGDKVTKRVDSLEFKLRNVDQHYPAILVYKNSKIVSGVKYGFEKADLYRRDIDQFLSK